MVERSRIRLLTGALASVFLPGLAGCVVAPHPGPPPRGYPPHYYDYYYYPYASVYFHIYTGHYYYHDHGRWRRVRRLPPHIRLDRRRRYPLKIREKEPWRRHDEHRRQYPPPSERRDRRDGRPPPPDTRRDGRPPPRREGRPPPDDRRERDRDRAEREHNKQRYEEYRKKPRGRQKD